MNTRTMDTVTIWVCSDCLITEATGELPADYNEDGQSNDPRRPELWSLINDDPSVHRVTMGMIDSEHEHDCPCLGSLPCANACEDGDIGPEDGPYIECTECLGTGYGERMDYDGGHDEPCEERSFSWSRCEGCGSTLGGSRHAYTAWIDAS